jgi:hypothetical protein
MDYPAGVNLMWNTSDTLMGAALSPLTLTLGPVFAFNVLMTTGVALSAWTAFLFLHRIVGDALAATLGGLVYGFSPFMVAQSLGHPQLTVAFAPPLILLVVHEALTRDMGPVKLVALGMALGALAAIQLLVGEEILATTALMTVTLVAIAATRRAERPIGRRLLGAAGAGAVALCVFGVLAAAPLAVQFGGPRRLVRPVHELNVFVSDALSFVVPTSAQQLAPSAALAVSRHFTGNGSEWNSYLGVALIVLLVAFAAARWRDPLVRLAGAGLAIVCMWSLGVSIHVIGADTGLPVLALALPLLCLARSVPEAAVLAGTFAAGVVAMSSAPILENVISVRLMVFAYLLAGGLLAAFVALSRAPVRRALAAGATVLALVPLLPTVSFPSAPAVAPPYFSSAAVARIPEGSVVALVPVASPTLQGPLLWQAAARMRFKQMGGYAIAPGPGGRTTLDPPGSVLAGTVATAARGGNPLADPGATAALREELARRHVRAVILGPMAHQDRVRAMLTRLLGRPPEAEGGVWVWASIQ